MYRREKNRRTQAFFTQEYAPAKGVDWVDRCQGSNPCFSAIK